MPSTSRCGVDSALPKVSFPVRSSKAAMSVKVPPMSAASRRLEPLAADGIRCFMFRSAMIAGYARRALDETPLPIAGRGQGLASSAAEGETMLAGDGAGETRVGRPLGPLHSPKRIV